MDLAVAAAFDVRFSRFETLLVAGAIDELVEDASPLAVELESFPSWSLLRFLEEFESI